MTNYYKDIHKAGVWIKTQVDAAKKNDITLDAEMLVYQATTKFPVGEKPMRKKISQLIKYENAPILE